ncbi:MAG: ATP-binding protein [bacterium]
MRINIKIKIILSLFLIYFVTVSGIYILYHVKSKKILTEKIFNHLESVASIQSERIKAMIRQNIERVSLVSSRTQLRLSLDDYLQNSNPSSQKMMNKILHDACSSIASFEDIYITTLNGEIIAATEGNFIGQRYVHEEVFTGPKKGDILHTFYLDENNNVKLYLSGPLYLDGKLLGVVVIKSTVDNLIALVNDYSGLGETGETLLAQKDAHGDALFITPLRFDPSAALTRKVSKDNLNKPIIQALLHNETFLENATDYRDHSVLAETRYFDQIGWGLVVKIDRAEAFKPISQFTSILVCVILGSLLIVCIMSCYLAETITKPIKMLTHIVRKIRKGDLTQRAEVTGKDEIGTLARAFNEMTENLVAAYTELEQKQKNILTTIFETTPDAYALKDETLAYRVINKSFCKFLGRDEEEILGKTDYDLFPPKEAEKYIASDKAIMTGGQQQREDWDVIGKDGSTWLNVLKSPVIDETGKAIGVLCSIRDISRLKKAEEALKEALVKAEEADRLKSAFLANMSHEIRTPMNAILGFTDVMLADELTEEHKEYLYNVKSSGDLLLAIIDDILDLSKIEAGQFAIEHVVCSLKEIVENAGANCHMMISHTTKNVALRQSFPDTISTFIIADPTRIQQIMNNLLSNAVKFTDHGFIEYGVTLKNEATLEFYVKDTGIGIAEDIQKKIFVPFLQADGSYTRKYGGTGLGLTITRKLVELMGGTITLKSKVGPEHGTTFYFTLPYKPAEVKEADEVNVGPLAKKTGHTILVAEDDELNQSLIRTILEKAGYHVLLTNDGKEAISIYKTDETLDLILMDIQMPVLDGYETTKIIRNIEIKEKRNRKIPIIALTAFAMKGDREKCIDAGMDDYIAKPIKINELLGCIEKILGAPQV